MCVCVQWRPRWALTWWTVVLVCVFTSSDYDHISYSKWLTLGKLIWCPFIILGVLKIWSQLKTEGTTEDEVDGWNHWLNGHEFEQAPGVGDGQGSLACCSPWGCKESDMTVWLNWIELKDWRELLLQTFCKKAIPSHQPLPLDAKNSLLDKWKAYNFSFSFLLLAWDPALTLSPQAVLLQPLHAKRTVNYCLYRNH